MRVKHRRSRRRGRNSWKGARRRHRWAALKGWRKGHRRRRKGHRGRRRSRNPIAFNRGRRRHRGRRRGRNPAGLSIRSPLKAVMAGFNVGTLGKAAVVVSGALGNAMLSGFVGGYLPSMLRTEPGNFVTGLATAGLMSAGVGMVAPRFAGPVFFGGVLEVVTRIFKKYVGPMIGLKGMGDYLSRSDAAGARPLGQYMGDYLSRSDAAGARPLGDYGGDDYIAEELAGM